MVGRSLTIGAAGPGSGGQRLRRRRGAGAAVAGWLAIRDLAGVNTAEAFAARYVTVSDAAAEQDMAKASRRCWRERPCWSSTACPAAC